MELVRAIETRRAIRKYKKQDVEPEKIDRILERSKWCPVALPFKQWEFAVVTGELRNRVADLLTSNTVILRDVFSSCGPEAEARALDFYKNLGDAPVLLFLTLPEMAESSRFEYASLVASAMTEYLLFWLLAHDEGLAACGITVPPYIGEEIKKALGIEGRDIFCGLSLGYADESPEAGPHPKTPVTYLS